MSNADRKVDVLVLGATGFTGRLIAQYLATHKQKQLFVLGLGARSETKLKEVVAELGIADKVDEFVNVDVKDRASVERAVKRTRVVINVVGPYWHYGTPVVEYAQSRSRKRKRLTRIQCMCPKSGPLCRPVRRVNLDATDYSSVRC